MSVAELLVPAAAAAVILPGRSLRRPARRPSPTGSTSTSQLPSNIGGSPAPVVAAVLLALVTAGVYVAGVVAGVFFVGRWQMRAWKERALACRLIDALPAALHDIARRLRSGYPAPLAFAEVLGASAASVRGTSASSMLARGEPLSDAVDRWRLEVQALVGPTVLDDLVCVVALSSRVGVLSASAVEVLAESASERQALEQEAKAQASQAKASATVMTIAPVVFSAQLVLTDPAASHLLLHTPVGWVLITVGVALDAAAWFWIRRSTARGLSQSPPSARLASVRSRAATLFRPTLRWIVFGRTSRADRLLRARRLFANPSDDPHSPPLVERLGRAVEAALIGAVRHLSVRSASVAIAGFDAAPWSTDRRRRAGLAVLLLPPLLVLRPFLGVVAVATLLGGPALHRRVGRARLQRERSAAVGQAIELVRLALECGATPSLAVLGVPDVVPSPLRGPLRGAADRLRQGHPFNEVMHLLVVEAPELRSMADVLLASSRLGLPVGETLRGLASEARASRRRDAEARARRLPVVLLFPVVCLTLPAFVLLTVAPLLLSGLGALHL